jgi:glyoxylase-like metal-dependent hydrolase (beta-lactamase superfamily II)
MIHLVDSLHLGTPHVIGIALVEVARGELAIVDSGPETVFDSVRAGIKALGFEPEQVRHLLASHIHLDHTGGAWRWAKEFGTRIYVHPRGLAHLVNPEKLIASATRIYGNSMEYLWGHTAAIAPDLVSAVDDGTEIRLGALTFKTIYTPGHAQHHNAYWLESQQTLFAGDTAGVSIDGGPSLPPFPPPDIHLESWKRSLDRIRALDPKSMFLTHFGEITSLSPFLDDFELRLYAWAEWMKERILEGKTESEIVPQFQKFVDHSLLEDGVPKALLSTYEQADPAAMSVSGLIRYWKKYHPEQLSI